MAPNFTNLLHGFFEANLDEVLILLTVISLASLIVFIAIIVKLNRIAKNYAVLMKGTEGKKLEEMLIEYFKSVRQAMSEVAAVKERVNVLERDMLLAVQKVHIKKYNAFDEVGGNLSFSIALLNGENSGVIITGIYGREESRVYLKPVVNGDSSYILSPEEKEVLERAKSKAGFWDSKSEF
ncbi:MAG: hypothetical protein PWP45_1246 [Tepidanaerobacteraceae bacterium]|nr:hypothetical protein [Tepidanaerobacteraceae bacterium]